MKPAISRTDVKICITAISRESLEFFDKTVHLLYGHHLNLILKPCYYPSANMAGGSLKLGLSHWENYNFGRTVRSAAWTQTDFCLIWKMNIKL